MVWLGQSSLMIHPNINIDHGQYGNSFPLVSADSIQVNVETPLPMWPCHIVTRPIIDFGPGQY